MLTAFAVLLGETMAYDSTPEAYSGSQLELFGGGRGEMILIDEDDVLESGIDLIAQPPGKRLQNVLLLSGGEKAMAAIALVLAIFQYRPSPFCILDEVDAPEDSIDEVPEFMKPEPDDESGPEGNEGDIDSSDDRDRDDE